MKYGDHYRCLQTGAKAHGAKRRVKKQMPFPLCPVPCAMRLLKFFPYLLGDAVQKVLDDFIRINAVGRSL
jgi:hypothetical protein